MLGVPENNSIKRYQSIGGYYLFLANKEILEGKADKRVCRSTLAAEASHLSEAVEAGDWLAVLLDEALMEDKISSAGIASWSRGESNLCD